MDSLNGRSDADLEVLKQHQADIGCAPRTLESLLETLGVFLRFCRRKHYSRSELPYLVPTVDVSDDDEVHHRIVDREWALTIIDYLATFHYASREHVVWLLLAEQGLRIRKLIALERHDYSPPSKDDGYLDLRHRPDTGTGLKNGYQSERELALSPTVCDALDDYIAYTRVETTDDYGCDPLLSTANGPIAEATIRTYVNKWTAPCELDNE